MTSMHLSRRVAACVAFASFSFYPAASIAGNMSLTIDTFPLPIEILSFKIGASNVVSTVGGGGGGAGKVQYSEFQFTAPESAATALQFKFVSTGLHVMTARLQVMAPDSTRPLSEWSLEDVEVASVGVENGPADPKGKAANTFLAPQSAFSLRFSKYCYRIFAADGSVARQQCFDIAANKQL